MTSQSCNNDATSQTAGLTFPLSHTAKEASLTKMLFIYDAHFEKNLTYANFVTKKLRTEDSDHDIESNRIEI